MLFQSRKIISTFFVETNVLMLGRWGVANNYSIVNKKIDFSNADNCFYSKELAEKKEKELFLGICCYSDCMDFKKIKN